MQATMTTPQRSSLTHQVAPDLFGLVSFAGQAVIQLPLVPVNDSRALDAIGRMNGGLVGGQTNMTAAIRCAARMLADIPPHMLKKILLVADGEPNIETEALVSTVATLRHARIRLDCVSVGSSDATQLLRRLCGLTVKGQLWEATTYDQLARAMLAVFPEGRKHRVQAATVLCLDCSYSMLGALDPSKTRMEACQQAAFAHLAIARRMYGHEVK